MNKRYSLENQIIRIHELTSNSDDVLIKRVNSGNIPCAVVTCDGMTDSILTVESIFRPLSSVSPRKVKSGIALAEHIALNKTVFGAEKIDSKTAAKRLMSGFAVILIDGAPDMFCIPVQGFEHRAISESYTEENVRSSREGFGESIKVNVSLIRRRLRSNDLVFRNILVGSTSSTSVSVVYLSGKADEKLVSSVIKKLESAELSTVLESGYLQPFLNQKKYNMFPTVGYTERPDVLSAKLSEGRVGVLVDGTPFALTVPHLFIENFQSFDDYTQKAAYSTFIRIVKMLAFAVAMIAPGLYVAIALHSPDALPYKMLITLMTSESKVAISLLAEALFIQLVYEIVREAGLRLPRPVGHAVSLIGALVVGESAIQAGLAGATMVMIAAFTAVCSFTIPKLYQETALFRFAFILIGGLFGISGITVGIIFVGLNICAADSFGVPYLAPLIPFGKQALNDGILKRSWRHSTRDFRIEDLLTHGRGSDE